MARNANLNSHQHSGPITCRDGHGWLSITTVQAASLGADERVHSCHDLLRKDAEDAAGAASLRLGFSSPTWLPCLGESGESGESLDDEAVRLGLPTGIQDDSPFRNLTCVRLLDRAMGAGAGR